MNLGGYTGLPETQPCAQQMIVDLLNQEKGISAAAYKTEKALARAVAMIEAALALNAEEKREGESGDNHQR